MGVQIIDDGMNVQGYLAACDEHEALSFTYRPVLAAEWNRFTSAIEKIGKKLGSRPDGPEPVDKVTSELVSKHIVEWDVTDSSDNPVDPTPENVSRLPQVVYGKILEAINTSVRSGVFQEQLGN